MLASAEIRAQEKSRLNIISDDFHTALRDGGDLFSQPVKWEGNDWLKLTAVVGSSALLSTLDEKVQDIAYRNPDYSHSFPMKLGKWYGEPLITAAVAGGFYAWGLFKPDKEARQIGLEVTESFIYSGLITTFIKVSVGRERPYVHHGQYSFRPFDAPLSPGANDHFSWPSGHSTVAFSLATVLASHSKNYLVKTLIYTPAVLTTVSRVYQDQHWVSDVFMGAAVGYFVGSYITSKHSGDNTADNISFGYTPGLIHFTLYF
ncbi:MAG: phosphatase PAP2 family protein [Syntrophothermus sp.]